MNNQRCVRCEAAKMKRWSELTDEEQEVVKRLPGVTKYSKSERRQMHRWCTRCWHEETESPRPA